MSNMMGNMMEMESIWQEYGLDQLEEGIASLFPKYQLSLSELFDKVMQGDILGAGAQLLQGIFSGMSDSAMSVKNIFLWLIILGIISALMTQFVEVFDKHQIADLSFYFIYLLMSAILLGCFSQAMQTAKGAIENIVLFVKLMVPTYLLSVGIATGATTVTAYYQLLLLLIYAAETIFVGVLLPLIYSFCLLSMVNGIWAEEKLTLFIDLIEKCVGWILKTALGIVTGISIFQSVVTPVIDSVKASSLQKAISALPGVGNAADGVVELVVGSAVVIKNSIGIILLLLLLVLCAVPLLQIFITAVLLKAAAAFVGMVGGKRITGCVNRVGDASMLLFRAAGTAMLLFLISLSIIAAATNRGF